jgi:hypothetical protein
MGLLLLPFSLLRVITLVVVVACVCQFIGEYLYHLRTVGSAVWSERTISLFGRLQCITVSYYCRRA